MENQIFNDDCFNVLPKISNESINLVVVDLPYGQTELDWDTKINLEEMWKQLKRILKPNGQVVFFTTTKFGNELINSNPKWFRYDIIWEKTKSVGFFNANKQPLRSHEMMYIFHNTVKPKDSKWTYNPQKTAGGKPRPPIINNTVSGSGMYDRQKQNKRGSDGMMYPKSILKISGANNKYFHSTQKPIELCEWLIKTYSNEGDSVLDFTMGSGSTIVAAINTNRKYIGIEKDEEIFKKAEKRINEN